MGVKGLWPLLEPVGRRISIEALANKRLAVGKLSAHATRYVVTLLNSLRRLPRLPLAPHHWLLVPLPAAAL